MLDNLQEAFNNIDLVSDLKDQFKDIVKARGMSFKMGFGVGSFFKDNLGIAMVTSLLCWRNWLRAC